MQVTVNMAASIYLSVCVKQASSVVVPTAVVKFSASSTFWDLMERVWNEEKAPEKFEFTPEDVSIVRDCQGHNFYQLLPGC